MKIVEITLSEFESWSKRIFCNDEIIHQMHFYPSFRHRNQLEWLCTHSPWEFLGGPKDILSYQDFKTKNQESSGFPKDSWGNLASHASWLPYDMYNMARYPMEYTLHFTCMVTWSVVYIYIYNHRTKNQDSRPRVLGESVVLGRNTAFCLSPGL